MLAHNQAPAVAAHHGTPWGKYHAVELQALVDTTGTGHGKARPVNTHMQHGDCLPRERGHMTCNMHASSRLRLTLPKRAAPLRGSSSGRVLGRKSILSRAALACKFISLVFSRHIFDLRFLPPFCRVAAELGSGRNGLVQPGDVRQTEYPKTQAVPESTRVSPGGQPYINVWLVTY